MSKEIELLKWLEHISNELRVTETEAIESLDEDNADKYNQGMRKKAELLASLSEAVMPMLEGVDEKIASHVRAELGYFNSSAVRALELDSVFFMSALLYPDNHRPGDPNNFDLFTAEVCLSIS